MGGKRVQRVVRFGIPVLLFVVPLAVVVAVKGDRVAEAFTACSPFVLVGATLAHVASLTCRCEAWRLAVNSCGGNRMPRARVHAASGAGFASGSLQGPSTAPVRAVALRRLVRDKAPPLDQALVAEAPVFMVDAALTALVFAFAIGAAPILPAWAPALAVGVTVALLVGLRFAALRFGHRRAAAGLSVLADRRRRLPLVALVGGTVAFGLTRTWLMLAVFGLPAGAASVALMFVAAGVFGSLPIGPSATPGATIAVFGATDATAAAAAGIALSATSIMAVIVYAASAAALVGVSRIQPFGTRSIKSVDQPNPRAASPSPVSGL